MSDDRERAELLAALQAAGASSDEDDAELKALVEADPSLGALVSEFRDSVVALASSMEPIETSPKSLAKIRKKIQGGDLGFLGRIRSWFSGK